MGQLQAAYEYGNSHAPHKIVQLLFGLSVGHKASPAKTRNSQSDIDQNRCSNHSNNNQIWDFFFLLFLLFLKDICNELASTYYLDIIPVFFLWENWLSIILVDCQISVVLRGTGEYVYEDQYCVKISYSYGCFSSVTYVKTSAADHTNKHTE